jgi:peptidoglycan hydrolase CwlO-like protein
MRNIINRIALVAAALMIMAVPVVAGEYDANPAMEPTAQGGKNECLLVAMNCGNQVDSIQQRIDRIQNEIKRGPDVYTRDEINGLKKELEDAQQLFEALTTGPGA